jgi:uncharacterized protein (DUF1778 family)
MAKPLLRTKKLRFHCTPRQHELVRAAAGANEVSQAEFMRRAVEEGALRALRRAVRRGDNEARQTLRALG